MPQSADLKLIFKLLSQSSSLSVVSDFLKSKKLTHSAGSWEDMYKLRIEPGLNNGQITLSELLALLQSSEEYGRQHVFLYRTTTQKASDLMNRDRISKILATLELTDLLITPRTFEFPPQPSFVDVRWHTQKTDTDFILKEVETRESREYKDTTEEGTSIIKRYERVFDRGVNIIHLKRSGDLEIRLQSRSGTSRYSDDLKRLEHRIKPFLTLSEFAPVPLLKAKTALWTERAKLSGKVRYSELHIKNDDNISLRVSADAVSVNVAGSQPAETSVNSFLDSAGYCGGSNVWFIKGETVPARDVHVVVSGEVNEFAVPTNCSEMDYEYVSAEIKALNT